MRPEKKNFRYREKNQRSLASQTYAEVGRELVIKLEEPQRTLRGGRGDWGYPIGGEQGESPKGKNFSGKAIMTLYIIHQRRGRVGLRQGVADTGS